MDYFALAWEFARQHPWICTAVLPCSWAAHMLTQMVKSFRKDKMGVKLKPYAIRFYSLLFGTSLSSFAFNQSPHIYGADQAIFLGVLAGALNTTIMAGIFLALDTWFPKAKQVVSGDYYYTDDLTVTKTVLAAAVGGRIKKNKRTGSRVAESELRRDEDITEVPQ